MGEDKVLPKVADGNVSGGAPVRIGKWQLLALSPFASILLLLLLLFVALFHLTADVLTWLASRRSHPGNRTLRPAVAPRRNAISHI